MISRRDALKLAAATGFMVPTSGLIATAQTPVASPAPSHTPTRGSWPMAGGNPARSGVMPGPIPSLDDPVIVRWRYEPENDWLRSDEPVLADGVVYVRGEDTIYAIDVDSGLEFWRYELSSATDLTIADGVVYAATDVGTLHAFAADTGLEIWRYYQGADGGTPTPSGSALRAPAVVDGLVVAFGDGTLLALDATTGDPAWQIATDSWSFSPIAEGLILVPGGDGLVARDVATGEERWRSAVTSGAASVIGNTVIAGGQDFLSGLDIATGLELWRYTTPASEGRRIWFSESLVLLTVFTENEYGYYDGELQAIDVETGGLHWMYSLGEVSDAWWGADVRIVDDKAYVKMSDPNDLLLAIDATTGLKTWEYRGYIADVYPVAVDNYLYFVHDSELFAIGNLLDPVLITDVTLRAAPAESGIERGTAKAGDTIVSVGARADSNGEPWVEITVGGVSGWVPTATIDPATLPPEGEIWTLYDPAWF